MRPAAAVPAIAALAVLSAPLQAQSPSMRLGWLAGCWQGGSGSRVIEEHWMAERDGVMLGMARTLAGESLRSWEFSVLRLAGDSVTFVALPEGQQRTEFRGRFTGERAFVVENLGNDFPTHVGYDLVSRDSLSAWIEGPSGGGTRRVPYGYHRVACDAP